MCRATPIGPRHSHCAAAPARLAGLSGAGWIGDAERLQLSLVAQHLHAHATVIELRPNLRLVMLPDRKPWAEEHYGQPFDSIVDRRRQLVDWTIETYAPEGGAIRLCRYMCSVGAGAVQRSALIRCKWPLEAGSAATSLLQLCRA